MSKKIDIIGSGYVGYSLGLLLAKNHKVDIYDIDVEKVKKINSNILVIDDESCRNYLESNNLNLYGKIFDENYQSDSDLILLCLPTNFNEEKNFFETNIIESVIKQIRSNNKKALIIIKSTIPIGFTDKMQKKFDENIIFSPEFLREGRALYDNLHPSRIIIGSTNKLAKNFSKIMSKLAVNSPEVIFTGSKEAELIKLASNTYLAMRVAFFNEIDTFTMQENLDAATVIKGISGDKRIGDSYNNPSFGYGGYCLPKDTKQLNANLDSISRPLLSSINLSNEERKNFFVSKIADLNLNKIGIYKLAMKSGSDNFRSSALLDIAKALHKKGIYLNIFEPSLNEDSIFGIKIENNFNNFIKNSDLILANRFDKKLENLKKTVFTRDLFNSD